MLEKLKQFKGKHPILKTLLWHLKQCLPLGYQSQYTKDGKRQHVAFRMWFGRVFAIRDMAINKGS